MIISKAIEILTIHNAHNPTFTDPDRWAAHKLGIEALKRVEDVRLHPFHPVYSPLPGESMPEREIR